MTELDAKIRAKLAECAPPAPKWTPVEASWSPAPTLSAQSASSVDQMRDALLAVLGMWQDPQAVIDRPRPSGAVAEAAWHYDVGHAAGINEAVRAIAEALGVEVTDD